MTGRLCHGSPSPTGAAGGIRSPPARGRGQFARLAGLLGTM